MKFITILLFSIAILAIVVVALGVGIFFSKKKKFPTTSISKNKDMAKLNITCPKHDELKSCGLKGGCCGGIKHNLN